MVHDMLQDNKELLERNVLIVQYPGLFHGWLYQGLDAELSHIEKVGPLNEHRVLDDTVIWKEIVGKRMDN